jgi:hypothetical protein
MRTLAANGFVSLDGVVQAPGGPEEDPTATACRRWLISLTAGGPQSHRLARHDAVSTCVPPTSTRILADSRSVGRAR